jgi:NAD(P)-dependent dehydrogenase (short-subunit alcohol dehydrogenase family)
MRTISELMAMHGRVAVITGGAGHIGRGFGEALSELGAHVVVVDLDEAQCVERARYLSDRSGVEALAVCADLRDRQSAEAIVDATLTRFGRLDTLVHNAAFTGASALPGYAVPFDQQSLPAWDAALEVNLTAAFNLTQRARSALEKSGRGSVVHVSSIYGVVGPNMGLYEGTTMGNPIAYAATKGALVQITRYLATVLAPRVRVNAISPGGIARGQPQSFVDRYESRTPLGRMGTEEDLKGALAFLCSDASSYVTGQNVIVDGGWTAW